LRNEIDVIIDRPELLELELTKRWGNFEVSKWEFRHVTVLGINYWISLDLTLAVWDDKEGRRDGLFPIEFPLEFEGCVLVIGEVVR
jgi:hypothetical protein